jgi:hypothetical protein
MYVSLFFDFSALYCVYVSVLSFDDSWPLALKWRAGCL